MTGAADWRRGLPPMRAQVIPPDLADPLARLAPRLRGIGHDLHWYPEVNSTSDVAAVLAGRGVPEGVVVVADAQTAGRGRAGRTWWSPPGAGLYVSIVLRPTSEVARLLTLAAGVAVAEGVAAATALDLQVKWPNDLYAGPRKLGGMLAEAAHDTRHVILGIGLNLLVTAYPPAIADRATSIEAELGRPPDRGLVLAECLSALDRRYGDLRQGRGAAMIDAWRARAAHSFGRHVEWYEAGRPRRGMVEDVATDGALLIQTPEGPVALRSGEVRWI